MNKKELKLKLLQGLGERVKKDVIRLELPTTKDLREKSW